MAIGSRIKKLQGKTDIALGIIRLMTYFHWNMEDMEKLSIPSYFELIKIVNTIEKERKDKK